MIAGGKLAADGNTHDDVPQLKATHFGGLHHGSKGVHAAVILRPVRRSMHAVALRWSELHALQGGTLNCISVATAFQFSQVDLDPAEGELSFGGDKSSGVGLNLDGVSLGIFDMVVHASASVLTHMRCITVQAVASQGKFTIHNLSGLGNNEGYLLVGKSTCVACGTIMTAVRQTAGLAEAEAAVLIGSNVDPSHIRSKPSALLNQQVMSFSRRKTGPVL